MPLELRRHRGDGPRQAEPTEGNIFLLSCCFNWQQRDAETLKNDAIDVSPIKTQTNASPHIAGPRRGIYFLYYCYLHHPGNLVCGELIAFSRGD